jgi:hypothetical protein
LSGKRQPLLYPTHAAKLEASSGSSPKALL